MSRNGAKKVSVTVANVAVTAHELTVEQINQWMDGKSNASVENPLAALLPVGDLMLGDLFLMSDLTEADANSMTVSQLEEVAEACQKLNKSFFVLAATLKLAGSAALDQLASSSTEPAPPS